MFAPSGRLHFGKEHRRANIADVTSLSAVSLDRRHSADIQSHDQTLQHQYTAAKAGSEIIVLYNVKSILTENSI